MRRMRLNYRYECRNLAWVWRDFRMLLSIFLLISTTLSVIVSADAITVITTTSLFPLATVIITNTTAAVTTTADTSCPKTCEVGFGPQTCDEIIKSGDESCSSLRRQGCDCDK